MTEPTRRGSVLLDASNMSNIFQRLYVIAQLSQLHMLEKYVLVFNKHLRVVDYTSDCLSLLRNSAVSEDYLLGKHLLFFAPDFETMGILDIISTLSHNGSSFCLDCYKNVSEVGRDLYVKVIFFRYDHLIYALIVDITKDVEKQHLLQKQAAIIQELERRIENSEEMQRNIYCSLNQLIFPFIDRLRTTKMNSQQVAILDAIAESMHSLIDQFARSNINKTNFSQRETQIAKLIQQGKTTKEISDILFLSCKAVDYHRSNLRKKLRISNTKNDLQSSLQFFLFASTPK